MNIGSNNPSGHTALITGGTGAIGQAIATRLAVAGHGIALGYRSDPDAAAALAQRLIDSGARATTVHLDVTEDESVTTAFKTLKAEFSSPDIVVNNAGVTRDGLLATMSPDAFDTVVAVNLTGTFRVMKAALRSMLRNGWGRIVNIGSVTGLLGAPGQANYTASKAGLIGLTRSAAREVASRGITINEVAPGPIESDMLNDITAERRDVMLNSVPVGRFGKPEEVAEAVRYLCSFDAAFITGAVIPVDGGIGMGV